MQRLLEGDGERKRRRVAAEKLRSCCRRTGIDSSTGVVALLRCMCREEMADVREAEKSPWRRLGVAWLHCGRLESICDCVTSHSRREAARWTQQQ